MADSKETQTVIIECFALPQVNHDHCAGLHRMLDLIRADSVRIKSILAGEEVDMSDSDEFWASLSHS